MATLLVFTVGFSISLALGLFSFLAAWTAVCIFAFASGLSEGYLHSAAYATEMGFTLTAGFVLGLIICWLNQLATAKLKSLLHTGRNSGAKENRALSRPQ